MMRCTIFIFAIFTMLCGSAVAARAQMVPAGDYTNMHYYAENGECLGYDLELWKMNGQLYGTLSYCAGLAGDTPTGYLDHLVWDAKTGKLTFDAKLSIGSDGYGKYSKDFYQFSGKLTAKLLRGKLTHQDMGATPPTAEAETVTLKLDKADTRTMTTYPTHDAWLAFYADIMSMRGPKW
jgi:hypothetical protein